ncbi:metalloendopeptidase [Marmoricola endophyticus]|uniref:Metalloendopeptidase n=1 Tax=Marmoricola endophyticus TaxID=2040280 RepID=A0A917BUW8_9ACTN|nr:M23 family metallopeptidase [Marmoricola endophyticus]GGF57184.1 metalloendopeptidase [Marmoricola endophyticus]
MAHFPVPFRPAHLRHRALVASALLALTAGSVATGLPSGTPAARADDLKDKHGKVRSQIKAAESDLEDTSAASVRAHRALSAAQAKLDAAQGALATSRAKLAEAQQLDAALQTQLTQAEAAVTKAKAELARQKEVVEEQRRDIGRQAAANLHQTSPQLVGLSTMLRSQDPATLPTGMQAVDNMMTEQNTLLDKMKALQSQLDRKKDALTKAQEQVRAKREAAAANLTEMARLEGQARTAEASVAALVGQRTTAQQAADKAKASDQAQLSSLNAEDARISAQLKKRAAAAKAAAARASTSGQGGGSSSSNGSGPLLRPVSGYVTSPFGYRVHPIYGYYSLHNGTDFHAPCGTPMKAVGNGKVIEKYYQSAWGNRLLIDLGQVRGHNVVVIYNHAPGYRVGVGDRVSRGEIVGYSGTTGWSTGCHLHFTVMVDGVPKNPLDWM